MTNRKRFVKIALPCLVVAGLTGCSPFKANNVQSGNGKARSSNGIDTNPVDSPIIIADGSTNLRHRGPFSDFHFVNQPVNNVPTEQVVVSDLTYQVRWIKICGDGNCSVVTPSPKPGWTIDFFDASNTKILTTGSPDNNQVVNFFHGNPIDAHPDLSGDTDPTKLSGTEITTKGLKFNSFIFTDGGGTPQSKVTCEARRKVCRIRIGYFGPN